MAEVETACTSTSSCSLPRAPLSDFSAQPSFAEAAQPLFSERGKVEFSSVGLTEPEVGGKQNAHEAKLGLATSLANEAPGSEAVSLVTQFISTQSLTVETRDSSHHHPTFTAPTLRSSEL